MSRIRRIVAMVTSLARPRRVAGDGDGDGGSAIVEFITAGVLLLIPTVYLVVALARIQAGVFASEGAARSAARTLSAAETEAQGRAAAARIVGHALSDQGFDDDPVAAATVVCSAAPCLTPGAAVNVTVEIMVPLPGVPGFLAEALPTAVGVSATHTAVVDEFRGTP